MAQSSKRDIACLVDSTKSLTESASTSISKTDSSKIVKTTESTTIIIFADEGGTVTVDSAGIIHIEGVKSIKSEKTSQVNEANAISETNETAENSVDLSKGVAAKQETDESSTEVKIKHNYKVSTIIIVVSLLILAGFFAYKRWAK
jgi:hypothetical protein